MRFLHTPVFNTHVETDYNLATVFVRVEKNDGIQCNRVDYILGAIGLLFVQPFRHNTRM